MMTRQQFMEIPAREGICSDCKEMKLVIIYDSLRYASKNLTATDLLRDSFKYRKRISVCYECYCIHEIMLLLRTNNYDFELAIKNISFIIEKWYKYDSVSPTITISHLVDKNNFHCSIARCYSSLRKDKQTVAIGQHYDLKSALRETFFNWIEEKNNVC
jgi:hypothetical protein